jgi:hypothetical protein
MKKYFFTLALLVSFATPLYSMKTEKGETPAVGNLLDLTKLTETEQQLSNPSTPLATPSLGTVQSPSTSTIVDAGKPETITESPMWYPVLNKDKLEVYKKQLEAQKQTNEYLKELTTTQKELLATQRELIKVKKAKLAIDYYQFRMHHKIWGDTPTKKYNATLWSFVHTQSKETLKK